MNMEKDHEQLIISFGKFKIETNRPSIYSVIMLLIIVVFLLVLVKWK
jgi:hypothetical protein